MQPLREDIATYDVYKSYEWNFDYGPIFNGELPDFGQQEAKEEFLGFKLNSRIGVPAGPLLNSNFIKLYAELGFDMLVYKTVRTIERGCHPAPNCVYAQLPAGREFLRMEDAGADIQGGLTNQPADYRKITITNSFGVPSKPPREWQADVAKANNYLKSGQLMIVSINGTPGLEERELPEDYALCAALAKDAGAKAIIANYSCPNVSTGEGSIYLDPEYSAQISQKIRWEVGNLPFLIKLGDVADQNLLKEIVKANQPFVDGFAGINTIAMNVYGPDGEQALPGEGRLKSGLCGYGIAEVAESFAQRMVDLRKELGGFTFVSVGGMTTAADLHQRLKLGVDAVWTATGAMWNPYLAAEFKAFS